VERQEARQGAGLAWCSLGGRGGHLGTWKAGCWAGRVWHKVSVHSGPAAPGLHFAGAGPGLIPFPFAAQWPRWSPFASPWADSGLTSSPLHAPMHRHPLTRIQAHSSTPPRPLGRATSCRTCSYSQHLSGMTSWRGRSLSPTQTGATRSKQPKLLREWTETGSRPSAKKANFFFSFSHPGHWDRGGQAGRQASEQSEQAGAK
jgi:hypothetical protein